MRPSIKSAIKIGLQLFSEADGEAEGELIHALVAHTMDAIEHELDKPQSEAQRRDAIDRKLRHFHQKSEARAQRWGSDDNDRRRRYHRHIAGMRSALRKHSAKAPPSKQPEFAHAMNVLEDAI